MIRLLRLLSTTGQFLRSAPRLFSDLARYDQAFTERTAVFLANDHAWLPYVVDLLHLLLRFLS